MWDGRVGRMWMDGWGLGALGSALSLTNPEA